MIDNDAVLLESRTLRTSMAERTDALEKVKALLMLPDGVHVTRRMVADYFEVDDEAIRSLVRRHRDELTESGFVLLKGSDLQSFLWVNMTHRTVPGTGLGVFPAARSSTSPCCCATARSPGRCAATCSTRWNGPQTCPR